MSKLNSLKHVLIKHWDLCVHLILIQIYTIYIFYIIFRIKHYARSLGNKVYTFKDYFQSGGIQMNMLISNKILLNYLFRNLYLIFLFYETRNELSSFLRYRGRERRFGRTFLNKIWANKRLHSNIYDLFFNQLQRTLLSKKYLNMA